MSGHSKWNNIKHKKEKTDAQKAKVFTKVGKEIAIAVREGGADPASNSKLRDLIQKAKSLNVPNDNIDRIIKKASGSDGVVYEKDGQKFEEPFDSVVVNGGVRPCVEEAETFFGTAPEFYVVGDAQITRAHGMQSQMLLNKPDEYIKGSMRYANFSAFMAASNI